MRPIEALLLAVVGLFWFAWWVRPRWLSRWGVPVAGVGVVLCLAHLALEGGRWQMMLTYAGTAVGWFLAQRVQSRLGSPPAGSDLVEPRGPLRWIGPVLVRAGVLIVGVLAVTLPFLLPVFRLPEPSGRYAVGRTAFHLEDVERDEAYTADPSDHRIVAVEVWYPADPDVEGASERYWPLASERSRIMTGSWGLPSFLFSHLALVKSHGHRDAPLPEDAARFPTLVFSHGLTEGYPEQNTALLEALASHGYAVFSIAHTYESLLVVLPDGRHASLDKAVEAAFLADLERIRPLRDSLSDLDPQARSGVRMEMYRKSGAIQRSLDTWRRDTTLLLDALDDFDSGALASPLNGRLDLSRIGVVGMSFGGATAGEVCLFDDRVSAGVNLDGYHYGTALIAESVDPPFMTMVGRQGVRYGNEEFVRRSVGGGLLVHIPTANHFDFSDFTLFGDLFRLLPLLGEIPPDEMLEITEAYVLGFFDHHLRGSSMESLLESPHPGITVRRFAGPERPTAAQPANGGDADDPSDV